MKITNKMILKQLIAIWYDMSFYVLTIMFSICIIFLSKLKINNLIETIVLLVICYVVLIVIIQKSERKDMRRQGLVK